MKKSYTGGDTAPRQKRLLRETLGFLESVLTQDPGRVLRQGAGGSEAEAVLKSL